MINVDPAGNLLVSETKQGAGWQVTTSGTGPTVTLTRAGIPGQSHYVCGIIVSSTTGAGDWLLQADSTTIAQAFNGNRDAYSFDEPLQLPIGAALSLTLQNAGSDTCKLTAWGYTR